MGSFKRPGQAARADAIRASVLTSLQTRSVPETQRRRAP